MKQKNMIPQEQDTACSGGSPRPLELELDLLLQETLRLDSNWLAQGPSTPLLGALPELDSMAAMAVLLEIENRFDIRIPDEDMTAEVFATFASMLEFVATQVRHQKSTSTLP